MVKVITYGTYDLLHYGHIHLLERAKALGDYLIVGVTAADFDKTRGKINVQQSLMERIEEVRATGIADEIIIEEYEGQKIDDIRRMGVDIFTVGSDWKGKFDYLNEYCKVVYLDRTQGVSSSEIRAEKRGIRIGLVGESPILNKFYREASGVNGTMIMGIFTMDDSELSEEVKALPVVTSDYDELLEAVEAVYIISNPQLHYKQIKRALDLSKHVLVESPVAISREQCWELFELAEKKGCVLSDGIKTAYSTAYSRMLLLVKGGRIGEIISIDATCTSIKKRAQGRESVQWNSIGAWGPTALLPVLQLLGVDYLRKQMTVRYLDELNKYDDFTKIDFYYPHATASIKVGQGVKSEGELIISGTEGYIYIPAPWWKTDYFEIRYENPADNKRYFYQLDGEGIRYEIVAFMKSIQNGKKNLYVDEKISKAIAQIMEDYYQGTDIMKI